MNVSISNPKGLNSPSGFSGKHGSKDREGPELAGDITPDTLIPVTDKLIQQAEQAGKGQSSIIIPPPGALQRQPPKPPPVSFVNTGSHSGFDKNRPSS